MHADEQISLAVQAARVARDSYPNFPYRIVSKEEAVRLREDTGLELEGFQHVVSPASIRHALKSHGDPDREASRGQIALMDEDFLQIPEATKNYDGIKVSERTHRGAKILEYRKRMPSGSIVYIEVVQSGKKKLQMLSMYKRGRGSDAPGNP